MQMKFWAVEVKNGGSLKVQPGEGKLLHLSQACLGEVKKNKGNDYVHLYVQKNDKKFVIGMLSHDRTPHLNLDLVFEDEFELSHDLKHGSVHFVGYYVDESKSLVDEDESDDDLEEPVPIDSLISGKPEPKDSEPSGSKANDGVKLGKAEGKVKIVEPSKDSKKNAEDNETEDEEDEDEDDSDESAEDEEMAGSDAGSDEEDDSDEEDSDEETPKKPEPSKKRPGESTSKTLVPEKKAKFSTPQQKTEGKKVVHVATPHPAKQTGKTPANADKSNKQTPSKSFTCPSCSKSFGSEQAVESHSKAKHSAK